MVLLVVGGRWNDGVFGDLWMLKKWYCHWRSSVAGGWWRLEKCCCW